MNTNSTTRLAAVVTAAIAMLAPAPTRAQDVTTTPALASQPALSYRPPVGTRQSPGPVIAPAGATRSLAPAPAHIQTQTRSPGENVGKTRAMMGVGLAAVIIGVVVGGDVGTVFVVGGGIVGLIGLYRFMK
jgi:hypothetical protein